MVVDTIGLKKSRVLLKVLLDPGSTKTLISRKALPRCISLVSLQEVNMIKTLHSGHHETKASEMVHLRDLRLPEFDKNKRIYEQKALTLKPTRNTWKLNNSGYLTMANSLEMQPEEEFFLEDFLEKQSRKHNIEYQI